MAAAIITETVRVHEDPDYIVRRAGQAPPDKQFYKDHIASDKIITWNFPALLRGFDVSYAQFFPAHEDLCDAVEAAKLQGQETTSNEGRFEFGDILKKWTKKHPWIMNNEAEFSWQQKAVWAWLSIAKTEINKGIGSKRNLSYFLPDGSKSPNKKAKKSHESKFNICKVIVENEIPGSTRDGKVDVEDILRDGSKPSEQVADLKIEDVRWAKLAKELKHQCGFDASVHQVVYCIAEGPRYRVMNDVTVYNAMIRMRRAATQRKKETHKLRGMYIELKG